jgi:hypothetical protein
MAYSETFQRFHLIIQPLNVKEPPETLKKRKKKVNQSRYRPGQAQRVPGSYGSQIS